MAILDPALKEMLDKLEFVKSGRAFKRWKSSFLAKFESFLEQSNIDDALTVHKHFSASMGVFVKQVSVLNEFVDKGDLSEEKITVKGRNSLNEMHKLMTDVINELDDLIPSTGAMEKKRGYTKFHIGAVLIRDDFSEYSRLSSCGDILKHMREVSLNDIADKQILEEMDNYGAKLQKFCDVMADIGLYQVMLKCIEFADEERDTLEDIIFIDVKTGGIGMLSREECLENKILKEFSQDTDGNALFSEAAFEEEAKDTICKMIMESTRLGIGFGTSKNTFDEEEVNMGGENAAKIANMWGVQLKKTPKNKKGEEFIFLDQRTSAYGEISRKNCIDKEMITVLKGDHGKDYLGESEVDHQERSELVEHIREHMQLGINAEKK
jgi:hypothetical protein